MSAPRRRLRSMVRQLPACKHCEGPLTEPLPEGMVDERLAPQDTLRRCARCGRVGIIDAQVEWRAFEDDPTAHEF